MDMYKITCYNGFPVVVCSNCNRELKRGEREYCDKHDESECATCCYLRLIDARTIDKYNEWLKKGK